MTRVLALAALALLMQSASPLRQDIEKLNAAMVAAFKSAPAGVAAFYSDNAIIVGGGQRYQGQASIANYWKGATMFTDWSLEVIESGGPDNAPWQYGRSVLTGRSGNKAETYFVGLLRRMPTGDLKFAVDAFTRNREDSGSEEAGHAFTRYLKAVEDADVAALQAVLDDQFLIVSGNNARNKAEEIADLVPSSGMKSEYFRSDNTQTRGFGALAVTTGVLKWRYGGRDFERNHSTISVARNGAWTILAQHITTR
jgi:ketosteroid isomerase-like protein